MLKDGNRKMSGVKETSMSVTAAEGREIRKYMETNLWKFWMPVEKTLDLLSNRKFIN